jgi:hypothetical protein
MIRLFFRLELYILALFLLFLGLMLALGPVQAGSGTLVFEAGVGTNHYQVFVDYDEQMLWYRDFVSSGLTRPFARVVELNSNTPSLIYLVGSQRSTVPLQGIRPIVAKWDTARGAILLAYREGDNAMLSWVNPATGDLSPFAVYENFELGFGSVSPDGRYFLLREEGIVRPIPVPKPMLLLDTETGAILDFGSPAFAYWSPDSRYIALGYREEERYESRIQRYEIATGQLSVYPVLASQEDTPFFHDNGFSSNGVLWSPDSQRLVVLNRDTETLYFLGLDAAVMEVVGGRITPLRWSPDSRFLLGIGYTNGEVGAFVLNATNGEIKRLQSPMVIQDALSDFAWSPDSRYIAVLTHSSGVLFEQRLILYDTEGQMLAKPINLSLEMIFATYDGTLRWLEEE